MKANKNIRRRFPGRVSVTTRELANLLKKDNPDWDDERVWEEAKKIKNIHNRHLKEYLKGRS